MSSVFHQALTASYPAAGGGFAGWTITGGTTQDGSASSHTVTLDASPASDDLILVFLVFQDDVDNNPAITGFTELGAIHTASTPATETNSSIYVLGKIAAGTEGTSLTLTTDSSDAYASAGLVITGNRNGLTTSELAILAEADDGTVVLPDPPSLTPSWGSAETLWVTFVTQKKASSYTPSTSYTEIAENGADNLVSLHVQYRENTTATENPGALGSGSSGDQWGAFTIGIRPDD